MRRFALPREVSYWSLSSIQMKLIKTGARFVSYSRMTIFRMAEMAVPERLFRSMLSRIHRPGEGEHEGARIEPVNAARGIDDESKGQPSPDDGKPGGLMAR